MIPIINQCPYNRKDSYLCGSMNENMTKKDIREFSKEDLIKYFASIGEPRFRATQVYEWLWKKCVYSFSQMTNLSKEIREKLQLSFVILPITEDLSQLSTDGMTGI